MNTYKKSKRLSCARCQRAFRTSNGLSTHACRKRAGKKGSSGTGMSFVAPEFREEYKRLKGIGHPKSGGRKKRTLQAIHNIIALHGNDPNAALRFGDITKEEYDRAFEDSMY